MILIFDAGHIHSDQWRLTGLTTPGNTDFDITELQFWGDGVSQMPSYSASLAPFFGTLNDLFDGSTATRPIWNQSDVNTAGFYIHVKFGTPRSIDAIKMAGFDTSGRYPTTVSLSWNDTSNYATKTLQASATGLTYPGNQVLSSAIDLDGGSIPARHTDWYIHGFTVSQFLEIAELQLLSGGVVQGSAFSFSNAPAEGGTAGLIDGSFSARVAWSASTAENANFYIQWNPGFAVPVNGVKIGAHLSSQTFTSTVTLKYHDGNTWQTLGSASGIAYPGNSTLSGLITVV